MLRTQLDEQRSAIASTFRVDRDGLKACAEYSRVMDDALTQAFAALPPEASSMLSILALGGYGRSELFPHSDIDVMVLAKSSDHQGAAAAMARDFLHTLWDAGLNVGHSVRTVDEALAQQGQVLDAWIAMLESRRICGNEEMARELYRRMYQMGTQSGDNWLVMSVFDESNARQTRFGSSVKLLEPNVKKSAGGLRDLHTVYWLYRGMGQDGGSSQAPGQPAIYTFLSQLQEGGALEDDIHASAVEALAFLFRVRTAMHLQRNSQHDTLEFALQREVAEVLGYETQNDLRSVEIFMRDYFLHARTVHSLYRRLTQEFHESLEPTRRLWNRGRKVGSLFRLREGMLVFDQPRRTFDMAGQMFEAFTLAAEHQAELDSAVRTAIERSVDLLTPDIVAAPACAAMMRAVFSSHRVADTLRDMNDTNVLGRIIPEFGDLVAFFQHNMYHYYTADEHTLVALAKTEGLGNGRSILQEVYRHLPHRELLFLAVLLHDIAKPRGVADHELTGAPMAEAIARRLGYDVFAHDVAFLVRHHLTMEQVAFRRNINDPDTLREFAARFETPVQLDCLFLLTFADLSAVNPGVWTEWKSAMLTELYQRTSEVLRQHLEGEQVDRLHEERWAETNEKIIAALRATVPPEQVRKHLDGIPNASYGSVFVPAEIADHLRLSADCDAGGTLFSPAGGSTDVTVVARDAPFALSRFCAVLAANDATIFAADVFTRDDGVIIDRFRVSDAGTGGALSERTCTKIAEDIRNVVAGTIDIDHLFTEHHRKWKRRPKKPTNPNIRTDVQFEDTARYTIVDVYAPDRVGFLYRVTESMSRLGLNIYFAKIATRVDGIVDAFYVLDADGQAIRGEERRQEIRRGILSTIEGMALRELTGE